MSSDRLAQARALEAIEEIKDRDDDSLMYVGEYLTDATNTSKRAVLAAKFAQYHSLDRGQPLNEFFDPVSGALVIVPKDDGSGEVVS